MPCLQSEIHSNVAHVGCGEHVSIHRRGLDGTSEGEKYFYRRQRRFCVTEIAGVPEEKSLSWSSMSGRPRISHLLKARWPRSSDQHVFRSSWGRGELLFGVLDFKRSSMKPGERRVLLEIDLVTWRCIEGWGIRHASRSCCDAGHAQA